MTHKIGKFYQKIYLLSSKFPKRDRFGIFVKIENVCLEILNLSITASFESKTNKLNPLNSLRLKIETLKVFFRIAHEMNILHQKTYIDLELDLQELSKMTNGWLKYLR